MLWVVLPSNFKHPELIRSLYPKAQKQNQGHFYCDYLIDYCYSKSETYIYRQWDVLAQILKPESISKPPLFSESLKSLSSTAISRETLIA